MARTISSPGMSGAQMEALKDMLLSQQQLLQKLYAELEQEREAARTAASEALAMILRLQEEKAVIQMEAKQYKRMAEEKISHIEKSLLIFEQLMFQKQLEITSLEHEVQAYKGRLLSLGCAVDEMQQSGGVDIGQNSGSPLFRRIKSLPTPRCKDSSYIKRAVERCRSAIPVESDPIEVEEYEEEEYKECTNVEPYVQSTDLVKQYESSGSGHLSSYWEQIKKLDGRVKNLTSGKDFQRGSLSPKLQGGSKSCTQDLSNSPLSDFISGADATKCQVKSCESLRVDEYAESAYTPKVYDIYEVQSVDEDLMKKEQRNSFVKGENGLKNPDLLSLEEVGSHIKEDIRLVKKLLHNANFQRTFSKPEEEMTSCLTQVSPTTTVAETQTEIQPINQRAELYGDEEHARRQRAAIARQEELRLLQEIREQLSSIQSEIITLNVKKPPPMDDSPLGCLKEEEAREDYEEKLKELILLKNLCNPFLLVEAPWNPLDLCDGLWVAMARASNVS
ncbi:GTD-binding domain [Dillenia turbinata]|uniref:GTD-binding domain n=1 Tax=Dillenia turbinata TaxID=194707 RepID=A0AAN8W6W6_9MAGN